MISAQEPHERDACEWPAWEVQGHGTVTGAGDPRDDAARREILPPWVDVRLTFADGARIDVLAVVRDGHIAIEDAQADPPLALEGFAALAEAIEAPLQNACQIVAGPHRPPVPETAVVAAAGDEVATGTEQYPAPAPVHAAEPEPEPELESEAEVEAEVESGPEPESEPGAVEPEPESMPAPESGRHRAAPSLPRGSAARRGVAEVYRVAQRAGQDPVLAVMAATGFSRRKALKLIAGARDEGHLTPRHHRR
ncbi:DUF6214 family protein [Streptomyces sp. NBC_01429]|uniref:DUF6214 family protein n=1 Tax=Streptomyces sp. NBC_01429 TaxID=2903862 RepID=UPI002E2B0BBE|nr:DUF6214 family protein [Streptomyces sp. NBC_01429]